MKVLSGMIISVLILGFSPLNDLYCQKKIPVRVYLEHFRNSEKIELSVRVITKTDKRYRPTEGIEVELYANDISPNNLLETLVTTEDGTAVYTFEKEQFELANNKISIKYAAVVNENDSLKGRKAEIEIRQVNFDVGFTIEDTVKFIHVFVSEKDSTGVDIPQEGVKIACLVERPLSPLPIDAEFNSTNEKGQLSITFPDDLPGDKEGYINVIVRIVDNEDYGTVEVIEKMQWGIATDIKFDVTQRSLWASGANAPISLLVFVISLILFVWGVIVYIVYKVFQISQIGKREF